MDASIELMRQPRLLKNFTPLKLQILLILANFLDLLDLFAYRDLIQDILHTHTAYANYTVYSEYITF